VNLIFSNKDIALTDSKATDNSDQEKLAQDVAAAMMRDDQAGKHLKIELEKIASGSAITRMEVRDDMVNGLGICHGGVTFTLADTTFALACNSRNRKTVAVECTINFVAASKVGDVLTAEAREISVKGRIGIYDITVRNQNSELIAEFRGTSYGTSSTVI
jgi:acyl-CoA thioesterase